MEMHFKNYVYQFQKYIFGIGISYCRKTLMILENECLSYTPYLLVLFSSNLIFLV